MNRRAVGVVILALVTAGCGGHGATQFEGPVASPVAAFGQCAFCHNPMATNMVVTAPELKCPTCHADQEPGMVGPGHRCVPREPCRVQPVQSVPSFPNPQHLLHAEAPFGSCAYCHNQNAMNMAPTHGDLLCPVCHDTLEPGIYGPGHESVPGPERVPSFPNPMHLLRAEAPFDSCAFCHNDKAVNMVPVGSDLNCVVCHGNRTPGMYGPGHESLPGPELVPSFVGPSHLPPPDQVAFGPCAYCHNDKATNVAPVNNELDCAVCHDNREPGMYGPGHEGLPGPELVPSFVGPSHLPPPDQLPFGPCAYCHNDKAINVAPVSNELDCAVCHDNREPGMYGPGHEGFPGPELVPSFVGPLHAPPPDQAPFGSCSYCHNDKAVNVAPVSNDLQCVVCHDDEKPGVYGPGHRGIPGPDLVPSFSGPNHALGAEALFGYCAYCHDDKAANMTASGVSVQCTFCHTTMLTPDYGPGHRSLPGPTQVQSFPGPAHKLGPEAVYGQCGFCHNATTVTALMSSGHGNLSLVCENCHSVLRPNDYGPGHETTPRCAECHSVQHTHEDPAVGTVRECTNCHTPHGSANIFLINEQIQTPNSGTHAVVFNNLMGLADGSFASVTRPGTGLCETCHTRTEFYRNNGTGAAHFPYPCFTCHPHAEGFSPN